jgi:hypothetical protein
MLLSHSHCCYVSDGICASTSLLVSVFDAEEVAKGKFVSVETTVLQNPPRECERCGG